MIKRLLILFTIIIVILTSFGTVSAIGESTIVPGSGSSFGSGLGSKGLDNSTNTNIGEDVKVHLVTSANCNNTATINFASIVKSGNTSIEDLNSVPEVPPEFKLSQTEAYYEIKTTATYSGPIIISLNYTGETYENESMLKLLHYENGTWVDCTTSVDTENKIIYGLVYSLSPFAILEKASSLINLNNPVNNVQNGSNIINSDNSQNSDVITDSTSTNVSKNNLANVNAATNSVVMQKTGVPLIWLVLAVFAIISGVLPRKK